MRAEANANLVIYKVMQEIITNEIKYYSKYPA